MLRRLVILFVVLASAVTTGVVAVGISNDVVSTPCDEGHTWEDWAVVRAATCTEEGLVVQRCVECATTQEVTIPALGHDMAVLPGSAKDPNCEEEGCNATMECVRKGCDYSVTGDSIDALGHAYGEWISNGNGTHKKVCANDGSHVVTENCSGGTATCTEKAICSVCGVAYGPEPAHVYDQQNPIDANVATEATCTTQATYYYTCECGEKGTETFAYGELADHVYDQEVATSEYLEYAANCQSPATYFKTCVCGAKGTETFTVGNPGNHNYDREVVHEDYIASVATCTEPAKYFYTCVCGQKGTETFSNGEALGHTWEEVVLEGETNKATDATCVTKATYYKVCDCNTVSTTETFEYGDYADHDYSYEVAADEYIAIKGNCQTATTYFKSCVCGEASTTDTFVGDEVGDHDFSEDNECVCGLVKVTATVSIEDVATENGWVSNSQYPSFVVDSHIKVSSVGGQHTGKYNSTDHSYRIYATDATPGSITISTEYIQNLVSIKFTTVTEGEYAFLYLDGTTEDVCNKVVNVDGNSVTFNSVKNGENGKHVRITAIEVVYVYKPCTTHTAGETKGYDETQHWDICSQCGEKMTETVENHIYDGTPENTSAKQHTVSCDCGATTKEDHSYNATSGKCDCGAEKPSEGDEPAGPVTITTVIADYATANNWADATMYDTVMMDDIITVIAAGGGDTAKYYSNGFEWRMYQTGNSEFTVVAVEGYEIISVKVTYNIKNSGVMTYNGANVTSKTLVEVNATSATFGVGNTGDKTNGQVKITAIEVVYKAAASSSEPTCEHTNTTTDQVNVVNATCYAEGSYDEVVTCAACGEELSRTHKTINKTGHTPAEDDGDCTTDIACSTCGQVAVEGAENHTPNADDGDCTTAVTCSNCSVVTTAAKDAHTPNADDGDCTTAVTCSNCSVVTTEAKDAHTPNADDGDCTTAVTCSNCSIVTTEAKASHTPEEDDGDCTTAIKCTECDTITTEAKASHTGGTATCKELAKCTECGTAYGSYASHNVTFTEGKDATCTEDGNQAYWACSECSKNFKEEECLNVWDSVVIDALNHTDEDNNKICDRESCKQALCDEDSHILVSKNDENYHWQECSACKNVFDKQEHTYTETVVAPTCTTDGYTLHECDCEYSYQSDEVSARHTPAEDDGDCTTAIKCTECGETTTEAKASHTPEEDDGDCTTDIGCSECDQVAVEGAENHTPNADDGDCTTAITCSVCGTITTEAKASHTPAEDDGDCTTDIECSVCDKVAVEGAENHTGGTATCVKKAECSVCGKEYGELANHIPNSDDGDCTTAITCSVCGTITTEAKASHTPEEDDGDCTTDIGCSECDQVAVEGAENHTGGTATCKELAKCTECGTAYGALGSHTFVNGTCSICSVPVVKTATLSFADTSSRESFSTEQQIWSQNGITFTNDKASSTTNVADYANPARFYKSSTLTIEAQAMVKIVFNCNSATYATELQTSIGTMEGVTVSISEKAVTVAFSANRDSFTVTLSGQVRMDSIAVTTSLCDHANKTNVGESKEATCTETGLTAGEKCSDCGYILTAQVATPKTAHDYVDGECSVCGAADPSAGGSGLTEQTATINTAGTTGTLASDKSSISWNSGGNTITNKKGGTAIRTSDSDHYRVYGNSTLVVSGSNITKVVLTATSDSYATVLGNSLTTEGATVSVSGSVVTVTVAGMLNEIEFKPTAQTRIKSVVITYMG